MTSGYVPACGPWDVAATLGSLRHHDLPGVQRTEGSTHTRVLATGRSHLVLRLHLEESGVRWQAYSPGAQELDVAAIDALVTWWFDLDTDTATIDTHLAADPYLGDHVRRRPGVRITRHPDFREGVLTTILGQQVSLAAARTFAGRLAAAYGTKVGQLPSGDGHGVAGTPPVRAFPDPRQVARVPLEDLRRTIGLTGTRARTLHEAAALLATHTPGGPTLPAPVRAPGGPALGEAVLRDLAALRGIGPWTRQILALRAAGDGDALPASDGVLRRALGGVSAREVTGLAGAWQPYRGYAVVRLWAQATKT